MVTILVAVALTALATTPAPAETVDSIVLRINDRIATLVEFESRLAERRAAIAQSDLDEERRRELLSESGLAIYREIYEELLLLARADQLDVRATDAEVAEVVAESRERMGLATREAFEQALAQNDMTIEDLEDRLRRNILVQRVMGQEMQERIEVEEEDLRRYYRRHEDQFLQPDAIALREVIVLDEAFEDPEEQARVAAELREALVASGGASEVVVPYREEGQTTGIIDHGWIERASLDPALAEAAWALEGGGVSEPVAARGGLHLLLVSERREAALRPFEEVRGLVERGLRESLMETEYPGYLRELEERAYIVLDPPPEAAGFTGLAGES